MNFKAPCWRELSQERPVSVVPRPVLLLLILALVLQVSWHYQQPEPVATATSLAAPPAQPVLELIGMGDSAALSRLLMLRLQAFDNQPGISIPFLRLDYEKVVNWLEGIARLDPKSQYPYLAAARVYAEVQDQDKKRRMLDFVHNGFLENPDVQWPAMAHVVFIAKHRLHDLDLALRYARDIRMSLTESEAPSWVRQMELFVLEDLGDLESARILLGGFLESGIIKDEQEFRFLKERLGLEGVQ